MATNSQNSQNSRKSQNIVERVGKFFLEDLWASSGTSSAGRVRRRALPILRVAVLTYEGFVADLCLLRASALTYSSLMAFVPVLALSFALLRGLGWTGDRLERVILERMTLISPDAIDAIVTYIDNTNVAGLGALGGVFLVVTFLAVMSNIETSMNAIWGDPPARTWARKTSDYLAVMLIAPLLLAAAISMTTALRSNVGVEWIAGWSSIGPAIGRGLSLGAYGLVWLVFAFLFAFVPNTKVRLVPALIGGVVAGTTWQLTQIGYINFQVGVARYNAIYGVMAQLPLLMLWVYVSWVIVLLGAEVSVAVQNLGPASRERRTDARGFVLVEFVALSLMAELAASAMARTRPPTVDELAARFDLPIRNVRDVVRELESGELVHLGGDERQSLFLSLAPSSIPVARVLDVIRGEDDTRPGDLEPIDNEALGRVLAALGDARSSAVAGRTVADLVHGVTSTRRADANPNKSPEGEGEKSTNLRDATIT
ncbi:MAG: membrane protein [Candidatus Binatia bacterium]